MRLTSITSESTLLVWVAAFAVVVFGYVWLAGWSWVIKRPERALVNVLTFGLILLVLAVAIAAWVERSVMPEIRGVDPFSALYWVSIRYTVVYAVLACVLALALSVPSIGRALRERRRVWRRVVVALASVGVSTAVAWAWAQARPGSELIRGVERPAYASHESRFAILSLGLDDGDARLLPDSGRFVYDASIGDEEAALVARVLSVEDVTRDFGSTYGPICPACVADGMDPLERGQSPLRTGGVRGVIRTAGGPTRHGADLTFVGGWSKRPPPMGFRVFWSLGEGWYIAQVWVGPMFEKVPLPQVLVIGPEGQLSYIDDAELAVVLAWCAEHVGQR